MFASPGAVAISTDFFTLYWYGIIIAFAFVLGQIIIISVANKEYKGEKLSEIIYELAFWALLGGIIGARLYYVILNSAYYLDNPMETIMLQNGGISIHGGIIGGVIATYIYAKKNNVDFLKFADLYALGLPIAQALGRWGNFFNSEAFGLPTSLPWGLFIPESLRPLQYKSFEFFHPTFLYESLWDIFIFLILFFVIKKYYFKNKGVLFFSYLILYSVGRIAIESIRIDSILNILGIPVAIWACIFTIIISAVFLVKIGKK
ncbi:MAG: prolipoprotein diacylglyceryl transferase [bacterium]|nr:prolipoprotein diacylglyceryl transferase [bacterium]